MNFMIARIKYIKLAMMSVTLSQNSGANTPIPNRANPVPNIVLPSTNHCGIFMLSLQQGGAMEINKDFHSPLANSYLGDNL